MDNTRNILSLIHSVRHFHAFAAQRKTKGMILMRKSKLFTAILLATVCVLLQPSLAFGSAQLVSGSASLTSFVSSALTMLDYSDEILSAGTISDYYTIVQNTGFRQAMASLISSYDTLKSQSWILSALDTSSASASSGSFGQNAWSFIYYANSLSNADTIQEYVQIITDEDFLWSMENLIASYNNLLADLGLSSANTYPTSPAASSRYSPAYSLRSGISATLTMKLATRLGPGTAYSEELGTMPQSTAITVIEQVMTHGVAWALVDFTYKGVRYRAYTGMKRISAAQSVPWGNEDATSGVTLQQTEAYYGPGYDYARHPSDVPASTALSIYGVENGFAICDFERDDTWIRAYVPLDSRIQ